MIINTKDFQKACKTILLAVNNNAANLELINKNNNLYLTVTDQEYYVSVAFPVESTEELKAVVEAKAFLDLISGLTADNFELNIKNNSVVIKSTSSKYAVPMIYTNDKLATLPVIKIDNVTVEMDISNTNLQSILNINSKELIKNKNIVDVKPLQKLYYLTQDGCFTVTTGSTLNAFTLEKPVQVLLTDKIVKLFKLFNDDVHFSLGHDQTAAGDIQTKVTFQTNNIYLAAVVNYDNTKLTQMQGACLATKKYVTENYNYNLTLSANDFSAAMARLMSFSKNSIEKSNIFNVTATCIVSPDGTLSITDALNNTEIIKFENTVTFTEPYTMKLNLFDLKLCVDNYKNEFITLNCGNGKCVIINKLNVSNLIPELQVG